MRKPLKSSNTTENSEDATGETNHYHANYFNSLYRDSADPWQYETRWYEQRKRQLCLAVLPKAHYQHAIELGCGNGVFSEHLARRCEHLISIDGNEQAVEHARQRLAEHAHVKVMQGVIPDVLADFANSCGQNATAGQRDQASHSDQVGGDVHHHKDGLSSYQSGDTAKFDLIVISEMLYYLPLVHLNAVVDWIAQSLASEGTLLCCHWRYDIDGFALNGETVHQHLRQVFAHDKNRHGSAPRYLHQTNLCDSDFLLDVWHNSSKTVAMQENLL